MVDLLSFAGTKDKLLQEDIVAALVKLKEEGPDNADGTRSLAAKALVNLSTLPASKTLASFPRLTPRDYELAKQEVRVLFGCNKSESFICADDANPQ